MKPFAEMAGASLDPAFRLSRLVHWGDGVMPLNELIQLVLDGLVAALHVESLLLSLDLEFLNRDST